MKINFFEIYIAQRSNLFFSQFTNISRNLIRIRRINGTSLWWNTWKWRETWIVIRRIIRVEGRTRFAFYPSPVTQKEHRIFGIQWAKEHRLSCSTFTHEHEKSVGEREPRHEYSCHWVILHFRVQLNRPRGSTRFSGIIVKRNERTSILFCNVSLVFHTRWSSNLSVNLSVSLQCRLFWDACN